MTYEDAQLPEKAPFRLVTTAEKEYNQRIVKLSSQSEVIHTNPQHQ